MSQPKRIVIVGGVAGGASFATRARRLSEDAEITMFERGEHISFANCGMPYHIGEVISDRSKLLVQTPKGMRRRYEIDVRTRHEVTRIDRERHSIHYRDLNTGAESSMEYDVLLLSPGAEPVRPSIDGIDCDKVYTLRSLADMDAIKAAIDGTRPRRAVVVGGGYIGLEMTEALRQRRIDVTLVELAEQVFIAADGEMVAPIHQQLQLHGVDLRLGTSVTGFSDSAGGLAVQLSNGEAVNCDLAILAIGVRPEVKLAKDAGLKIGQTGGIAVDDHMRSSDPNIFAVGDAVEVKHMVGGHKALIPLAGPANRQGRIAADNALGRDSVYRDTQGTAICKVFDLAIGMTGLSEKQLQASGRAYEKVYIHSASHAGYYPGAAPITLKLLFDPAGGRILGSQAVGSDGVDKRIDVLAVAIRAGLTVYDLRDMELSYAPPYGSAKDPVNYAGFIAANVLDGDVKLCHTPDMLNPADGQVLLDVRTLAEVEAGTIPGAMNIPVDDLRKRLGELDKSKEYLVFCQVGLRGYLACRILTQNGFNSRNLTGGYKTFTASTAQPPTGQSEKNNMTETSQSCCPNSGVAESKPNNIVREIDARGLQCPGPIMQLKNAIEQIAPGQAVTVLASDPGFAGDIAGWCHSTGNSLGEVKPVDGGYRAVIVKGAATASCETATGKPAGGKNKTIVCFSGDFDKAMAGFIIANGAAAMGSKVTMFFTFWGLNILRRGEKVKVKKNLIERMFGWMMPRGADKLGLSQMHMGGMGLAMIKGIMKHKNVAPLGELIESAKQAGVQLVACSMSMDLMGIKREELIDGVQEGGVAMYLDNAESGNVNLFI